MFAALITEIQRARALPAATAGVSSATTSRPAPRRAPAPTPQRRRGHAAETPRRRRAHASTDPDEIGG